MEGGARGRRRLLVVSLILVSWMLLPAGRAGAFGTIEGGGQHREHERITRAALSCAHHGRTGGDCFESRSMDQLAGRGTGFGGIGAPDRDEVGNPAAHCDNADFLANGYPRTREQATVQLLACIDHLRAQFRAGLDSAKDLLDDRGRVVRAEVELSSECRLSDGNEGRAKCKVIEALGRALHGVQDFYAHSNWADEADPARPIGPENPPGLNRPGPSALLDLRGTSAVSPPADLITGCYVLKDEPVGVGACTGRVTHAALNKDNGLVDPDTGGTTDPTTPRGTVRQNFAKAVAAAIADTRRQWQDFRTELSARYGEERAARMACAITHDDPGIGCNRPPVAGTTTSTLAGLALTVLATALILAVRRLSSRR